MIETASYFLVYVYIRGSEYHKVCKARTVYGEDLFEHTEAGYLQQFNIKYFSDLIDLEEV